MITIDGTVAIPFEEATWKECLSTGHGNTSCPFERNSMYT